ncbi:hypothetical protein C8Q77DRAFT_806861 [Trametes polyzona]|nr:hypothetical protein C8Q77DRAFT_806861 [Trametes polyzona]
MLSVTPADVFALLFQALVFILVVLSVVTLVRRYLRSRVNNVGTTQAQTSTTRAGDDQLQASEEGSTVAYRSRTSRWLPSLSRKPRYRAQSIRLDDDTALLRTDGSSLTSLPAFSLSGHARSGVSSSVDSIIPPFSPEEAPHYGRPPRSSIDSSILRGEPIEVSSYRPTSLAWECDSATGSASDVCMRRIPTAVETPFEECAPLDLDTSSPASTCSEFDTPSIATPPLGSPFDGHTSVIVHTDEFRPVSYHPWDARGMFDDGDQESARPTMSTWTFQKTRVVAPSLGIAGDCNRPLLVADEDRDDREETLRFGGQLTSAFTCPLSQDSLSEDPSEGESEEDAAEDALDEEWCLRDTESEHRVEVCDGTLAVSSFAAAVEWYGPPICKSLESSTSFAYSAGDGLDTSLDAGPRCLAWEIC